MERGASGGSKDQAQEKASPAEGNDAHGTLSERWWFSPILYILCGTAVAGFQWEPLSTGGGDWLNWLVLAAGLAVLAYGIRTWYSARPR